VSRITEVGGDVSVQTLRAISPLGRQAAGRLSGRAFDVNTGRPLGNARIDVTGTALGTISGSDGRFAIETVPSGRYTLRLTHPQLDSLGLDMINQDVQVTTDSTSDVILQVPPLTIVMSRLCQGHSPGAAGSDTNVANIAHRAASGVVRGRVTTGDGSAALNAGMEARWTEYAGNLASLRIDHRIIRAATQTDSLGRFLFCGLPTGHPIRLYARRTPEQPFVAVTDTFSLDVNMIGVRGVVLVDPRQPPHL
jgi:hypothetical protein